MESTENVKVIVFRVVDDEFGVDVRQVSSIEQIAEITKLPETAPFIKGVMNLRGTILPVMDLRERLGAGRSELSSTARLLVVDVHKVKIGLLVDSAHDVIDIEMQDIETKATELAGIRQDYLQGVAKVADRLLVLLRLDRIVSADVAEAIATGSGVTN